jgi:hypothetical protein
MKKRSAVRKCNVKFDLSLQNLLNQQGSLAAGNMLGVQAALTFAQAITGMCLTGTGYGYDEKDIPKLPSALRPAYKVFLGGWSEYDALLEMIARSTRVEILVDQAGDQRQIRARAVFFEKARNELGHEGATYDLATGLYLYRDAGHTNHYFHRS